MGSLEGAGGSSLTFHADIVSLLTSLKGFLFYHEKQSPQHLYSEYDMAGSSVYTIDSKSPQDLKQLYSSSLAHDASRHSLIKQTYTVFVDTTKGQRKWHLSKSVSYYCSSSPLKALDPPPSRIFHGGIR
jgi:hypothetical protein